MHNIFGEFSIFQDNPSLCIEHKSTTNTKTTHELSIYERYCQLRDHFNYKDSDISRMSGIAKSTFSDWKNERSRPKQAKLEKIAKALNVTVEYLKGISQTISCPFCGFEYDPLTQHSSADHDIFHSAFKCVKDKYPFLLSEKEAISVLKSCYIRENLSTEEQIEITEKKILAEFSIDLKKQCYPQNMFEYEDYRLIKLSSILSEINKTPLTIYDCISGSREIYFFRPDENVVRQMLQKYQEDMTTKIIENEQLLCLFSYITQLPKEALDLLEIQLKAWVYSKKSNNNNSFSP